MSTARKFVDADLRGNPDLIAVAIKYAEQYTGEFGFLCDARQVVMDTGSLPLPVARGVLNCMRVDPNVVGLEQMQRKPFVVSEQVGEHPHEHRDLEPVPGTWEGNNFTVDEEYEEEEEIRERSYHLYSPLYVKLPFVHGTQRRAVLHRVGVGTLPRWVNGVRENLRVNGVCTRSFDPDVVGWHSRNIDDSTPRTRVYYSVHRQCNWQPLHDPVLVAEKPEGMSYCRSGCFGFICGNCKKRSTLKDSQKPDDLLAECEWCTGTNLRKEYQ